MGQLSNVATPLPARSWILEDSASCRQCSATLTKPMISVKGWDPPPRKRATTLICVYRSSAYWSHVQNAIRLSLASSRGKWDLAPSSSCTGWIWQALELHSDLRGARPGTNP